MKNKTHKRIERHVALGEKMACGMLFFNAHKASFRWKDVDCKRCLAKKTK